MFFQLIKSIPFLFFIIISNTAHAGGDVGGGKFTEIDMETTARIAAQVLQQYETNLATSNKELFDQIIELASKDNVGKNATESLATRFLNAIKVCKPLILEDANICKQTTTHLQDQNDHNRLCQFLNNRDAVGNNKGFVIKKEALENKTLEQIEKYSLHEYVQNCLGHFDETAILSGMIYELMIKERGIRLTLIGKECKVGGCLLYSSVGHPANKRSYCEVDQHNPKFHTLKLSLPFSTHLVEIKMSKEQCLSFFDRLKSDQEYNTKYLFIQNLETNQIELQDF